MKSPAVIDNDNIARESKIPGAIQHSRSFARQSKPNHDAITVRAASNNQQHGKPKRRGRYHAFQMNDLTSGFRMWCSIVTCSVKQKKTLRVLLLLLLYGDAL